MQHESGQARGRRPRTGSLSDEDSNANPEILSGLNSHLVGEEFTMHNGSFGPGNNELSSEDLEPYPEDGLSETASVLTIFLSHQEGERQGPEEVPAPKEKKEEVVQFTAATTEGRPERARTAPPRPLTELEELRASKQFLNLERAAIEGSQLIQHSDNKFDLDSSEGQDKCKRFLQELEGLCESFKVQTTPRHYRAKFSQAYRVLYKEGQLSYLTEILDSAQEAFPYLWVNSEKYVFSQDVLESAESLFSWFCKIKHIIRNTYNRLCEENPHADVRGIISQLRSSLETFDFHWANFEQWYVMELMMIERNARKRVVKGIEFEREIYTFEKKEKLKGKVVLNSEMYNDLRRKFVEVCGQINAVANSEGKGRDDLSVDILLAAEGISRRITNSQSRAVRKLADQIKQSFTDLRKLFQKYSENIELVDPQLRNNPDLVEILVNFEKTWEKGKEFLVNPKLCNMLIYFSLRRKEILKKLDQINKEKLQFPFQRKDQLRVNTLNFNKQ